MCLISEEHETLATRHGTHTGPLTERHSNVPVSEGRSAQKLDRASRRLALQRYLMGYLMEASFPVREIGTVMTLLHARYELEDLIRMEHFQGQNHL